MLKISWRAAVLGLALASGATNVSAASAPNSNWRAISNADLAAAAPPAVQEGLGGRAIARCHVEDSGRLSDCVIVRETPAAKGFGAALLSLAPKYAWPAPGSDGPREVSLVADWFHADGPTNWLKKPAPNELAGVYPKAANGAAGAATIDCIVTTQGALNDCYVLWESPEGKGFGAAAIGLTPQFLMKPATWKGAPTMTTARIPIHWEAGAVPSGPAMKSLAPANLAWAEAPSFADVAAAYPKKARAEKLGGHVTLKCEMNEAGRLAACDTVKTEPTMHGFESAAHELAKRFRYSVNTPADRQATHRIMVMMPFTFDPAVADQAQPAAGRPTWAAIPDSGQMVAAFAALKLSTTARATLSCLVQPGGSVSDCAVVSELPAGAGAAALGLTPAFRVSTWTTEGLPVVGGRITIPLRYEPDTAPTPSAAK